MSPDNCVTKNAWIKLFTYPFEFKSLLKPETYYHQLTQPHCYYVYKLAIHTFNKCASLVHWPAVKKIFKKRKKKRKKNARLHYKAQDNNNANDMAH